MFALLIIIFLIMLSIIPMIPFFGGWKSSVGAIIITLIVAVSGGINKSAIFFAGLGGGIEFLGRYSILRLITSLVVLGLIFLGTNKVSSLIKNKMELDAAKTTGARIKEGAESAQVLSGGVAQLGEPEKGYKKRIDF
jgi:hypothetical protein